jgi:hypothetical protein
MAASELDPVDFSGLKVDEYTCYKLMANHVLNDIIRQPPDQKDVVMMSVITKLLVENFILNLRLQQSV